MATVSLALHVLLAVVLGWSAATKLTAGGRAGLRGMLAQLGVRRSAGLVGGALITAEAASAVLLLLPWTSVAGSVLATGLLAVLTAGVVVILRRRLDVKCACFGAATSTIGPIHVVRNSALLFMAIATGWLGPHVPDDLAAVVVAIGIGGVLALVITRLDDFAFLLQPR